MSVPIEVPALGESISDAIVISITDKKVGDPISSGEVICQLETDKVTIEVSSPVAGVLESMTVEEGQTVNVGDVIGEINDSAPAAASGGGKKLPDAKGSVAKSPDTGVPAASGKRDSPAATKLMQESNIDKSEIHSVSGRGDRITKADVLVHRDAPKSVPAGESVSGASRPGVEMLDDGGNRRCRRVRMSKLRQKIAERLKTSQNTAAILTTFNEVDMSAVMDLRARYKDSFFKKHGVKLGFMSFFVKASIEALKNNPDINAEISGEDILYKDYYDIGVAIGTDKGLVVPIIRNAEQLSMHQIEAQINAYAVKAQAGKLTMEDMSGGTFTISNGGTYGSMLSTPIINPPQSGILGMHNIVRRPVVVGDSAIEVRPIMYVALSYDHRIVDGKGAVTFLVNLKEMLEDPYKLVLGV